jgi:hypothetical protein
MLYTTPQKRTALVTTFALLLCSANLSLAKDNRDSNTAVTHTLEHAGDAIETVADCVADSDHCDRALAKTTAKVAVEKTVKSAVKASATIPSLAKQALKTASGEVVAGTIDCVSGAEDCGRALKKAVILTATSTAAIPTAVAIASATGATAGTGTAIAALSGAPAVSATTASVGSAVISASGGTLGAVAAPAVIGAAAIGIVGLGVGYLIFAIFD